MSSTSESKETAGVTVSGEIDLGHDRGRVSLIYLARHGESGSNLSGEWADPMTNHLSERGQRQAQALGDDLADIKFTRVYSSNYPRAIETAQIGIGQSKHSKDIKLRTDPRIREREDGEFVGQPYSAGKNLRGQGIEPDHPLYPYKNFVLPGREPVEEILERQKSFFYEIFEELDKSGTPETVLIVSHDYFIRLLMTHVNTTDKYETKNWVPELGNRRPENCGYHIIEVSKQVSENGSKFCWNFVKIHQFEHLKSVGFAAHGGAGGTGDNLKAKA